MTLKRFEKLLKQVNPKLRIRQRGWGDVGGIFAGKFGKAGYIARITKGELNLHGYRAEIVDPANPARLIKGKIRKRGRKTLVMLLRNWRWLPRVRDRCLVLWGIERR